MMSSKSQTITRERTMATDDTCVTIVPYFKVKAGQMDAVKTLCAQMVEKTKQEPKCLFYGFSFNGEEVHCREGYTDGAGAMAHLDNVGELLKGLLEKADLNKLEIHGPAGEIDPMREPLTELNPHFFTLELGFRR